MAALYRKYIRLLEQWPVDPSKKSRDLGQFLREQVKTNFSAAGALSQVDEEKCDRAYWSLKRLADNHYCNTIERRNKSDFVEHIPHIPVMAGEVISYLSPTEGNLIIDMTFGAGGHTEAILHYAPNIKMICVDRDPVAFDLAQKLEKLYPSQVHPILGRFSELPSLLNKNGVKMNSVDGILFDFGCSSMQFDVAERGFSISKNGPLDMRMDGNRFPNSPTAADVLATADEHDLAKIFKIYGEEKLAKKVAAAVIEARYLFTKLEYTQELSDFVSGICNKEYRLDKLQRSAHVATKIFQALRIFVNNELNEINYGMLVAEKYLKVGGRLVALSFHSLEDKIVKRHFAGNVVDGTANTLPLRYSSHNVYHEKGLVEEILQSNWSPINKHVVTPTLLELETNPRCRSAKLRCAEKIN